MRNEAFPVGVPVPLYTELCCVLRRGRLDVLRRTNVAARMDFVCDGQYPQRMARHLDPAQRDGMLDTRPDVARTVFQKTSQ